MQDTFAYCAELVRTADRDRFIASLFAPAERRGALDALYAFNVEVTRVRDVAHAALPGEIRLQWWSEVINGERADEGRANPVAAALLATIERFQLPPQRLIDLVEAHRFDLYDDPMASAANLEAYALRTSSTLFALAMQIVAGVESEAVAGPAGVAFAITSLLQSFPRHVAMRQLFVPADVLQRHEVRLHDVYAGKSSAGLRAALTDLRDLARRRLVAARAPIAALPRAAVPALLPLALVRGILDRMEGGDPFAPAEIAPWRRQWLMWRASHNQARITQ
jgi:15-cis-phytoene synthase